jgi:SpoVK/Ycf46/Vps4 family AAA+-type ATPase
VSLRDLFSAGRAQSGHDLATLAHKIAPVSTWDDIVLPDDALAQLREICQQVIHQHRVLGAWGLDRKLSQGKGINVLFAGPSGTGKTMAAEIIANELGLDLYKIDLSGVVSKYIRETEKNLDCIFRAAENANAILFFDEANALFGKRS